ncbi:MAG: hypothetical protein U0Q16_08905 [Bryobacteraceae bacterium]
MVFWRLLRIPPEGPLDADPHRSPIREIIVTKSRRGEYTNSGIAWDGAEAWYRTALVDVNRGTRDISSALFGPFLGEKPEPATHAFLDFPRAEDDAFDSLWRTSPQLAAASDWLIGKPAHAWMAAVEEVYASHPGDLYRWIVQQPECPAPVAGRIFWMHDPVRRLRGMINSPGEKPRGSDAIVHDLLGVILDRWRTNGFAPSNLDFSCFARPNEYRAILREFPGQPDPLAVPAGLLDPAPGMPLEDSRLCDDFDFWCIKRGIGGLVPRPRSAAIQEWQLSLRPAPPEPSKKWRWRDLLR